MEIEKVIRILTVFLVVAAFAVKVGGGSEIKIKDFILYFSHLLAYL